MKTIVTLAIGVWIGHQIFTTLAINRAREKDVKIRKQLENFLQENLPALSENEMQSKISEILKCKEV